MVILGVSSGFTGGQHVKFSSGVAPASPQDKKLNKICRRSFLLVQGGSGKRLPLKITAVNSEQAAQISFICW